MAKLNITFEQLATSWLAMHPGLANNDFLSSMANPQESLPEIVEQLSYYASETQNWATLNTDDFSFDGTAFSIAIPDNGPIFCKHLFARIQEFSNWVTRSYEDELHPWEQNAWDLGYCSGDDDVDYNSGYLDSIIGLIELHLVHSGLTYRELTTYIS